MDRTELEPFITRFLNGDLSAAGLLARLTATQTADLGHTQLDLDRARRCGFPEVVYAPGKTPAMVLDIVTRLVAAGHEALVTRVSHEQAAAVAEQFPALRHNPIARTLRVSLATTSATTTDSTKRIPPVAIVTAGTTDLAVAEEARETADWMGCPTRLITDVGVAGPQRLIGRLEDLQSAAAIVVVAGMEGALPSMVGGYVRCPVIAVPTSVGYGASLGGFAALLSMLNSCAANVTVVNIDAGFKAGYVAGLIARGAGERLEARA